MTIALVGASTLLGNMSFERVDFDVSMDFAKQDGLEKKRLAKKRSYNNQFCKNLYNRTSFSNHVLSRSFQK